MPGSIMFDCFFYPSNSKFNFVTAINKEIIFFNDLGYGPNDKGDDRFQSWNPFLNLLEGTLVNVAMTKNVNVSDQEWNALQPIFATSNQRIVWIINGKIDYGETSGERKVELHWIFLHWKEEKIDYSLCPCARCFAQLIIDYGVTN